MSQPSPQFIQRLEQELRYAYRAQYQSKKRFGWSDIAKVIIPTFSGLFVIALLLINFVFKSDIPPQTQIEPSLQAQQINSNTETVAFSEGQAEEELINSFDDEELNQIYNGVQLAAAGN